MKKIYKKTLKQRTYETIENQEKRDRFLDHCKKTHGYKRDQYISSADFKKIYNDFIN